MKVLLFAAALLIMTVVAAAASVVGKNGVTYYYPWQGDQYQTIKADSCRYYSKLYAQPVIANKLSFDDVVRLYALLAQPVYDQQAETDRRLGNVRTWDGRSVPAFAQHNFFDAMYYLPTLKQVTNYDDIETLVKATILTYRKWELPVSDEIIRLSEAITHKQKLDAMAIIRNSTHREVELDEGLGNGRNINIHSISEYMPGVCQHVLSEAQQKESEKDAENKLQAEKIKNLKEFRSKLNVGEDTHCGMIIEIKRPIAKVQTMIGDKWFKTEQLFPRGGANCRFVNGEYIVP